ncbi:MAG: DUF3488 and transglutaminase-like domain-containing protein [Actinobacteria bacterium]|nr:DUF3488 and transglutaminase-like domain-containing protein [Actinomycetota bacterium]
MGADPGAGPMTAAQPDLRGGAQPVATLLAAAAVVAATLPLGRLFAASPWWPTALVSIAVVAGLGLVLRARRIGPTTTALGQLLGVVIVHSVAFGPADRPLGGWVPTWSTVLHWRTLTEQAGRTIMENAAPAPAPVGIAFVISAAVALVAWATDVVAVGSRMPAVAGLPLLTPLLTAVANGSASLAVGDIVPPLLLWGAMLVEQERDWLASWRPDLAGAHRLPARGRRLGAGAALVVAGLVLGLAGAATIPHLPQRYIADGLGRGDLAAGNRVGFSPDTDLLQDLRSGDRTPILTYTSDDAEAPPLRVTVSSAYGEAHWTPRTTTAIPSQSPVLPRPPGLSDQVPRVESHLSVSQTSLGKPYVASPVPVVWGTVVGARWNVDEASGVPVVDVVPRSYDLTYLSLNPTPEFLAAIPPTGRGFRENLVVPAEVRTPRFQAATDAAIGAARTPYEQAVNIQQWLRESGGFSYSLELAPVPTGMSETVAKRTALDRFLETKKGYCVQFATAMVMMARSEGIPARLATGFLPGSLVGSARTVVASDAHAWPELYFEGVGWLRFEPTPSVRSGPVPRYAGGLTPATPTAPTPSALTPTTTVTPTPSAPTDRRDTDTGTDAGALAQESVWTPWLRIAGGLAILLSIVPAAAAAVRARRRARAQDAAAVAEAEWLILAERLADLGLEVPVAATPRQLHARMTDTAVLDRESSDALRRVLLAVEDARYAVPVVVPAAPQASHASGASHASAASNAAPAWEPDLRADARTVLRGAVSLRSGGMRARAVLLPRAGLRALRLPVPTRRSGPGE